jgi:hypothetical protein
LMKQSFWDLPRQYVREVYQIIEAFSSSWPIFSPPDSQDFMATKDGAHTLIGQEGSTERLETPILQNRSFPS